MILIILCLILKGTLILENTNYTNESTKTGVGIYSFGFVNIVSGTILNAFH